MNLPAIVDRVDWYGGDLEMDLSWWTKEQRNKLASSVSLNPKWPPGLLAIVMGPTLFVNQIAKSPTCVLIRLVINCTLRAMNDVARREASTLRLTFTSPFLSHQSSNWRSATPCHQERYRSHRRTVPSRPERRYTFQH